MNTRERIEKASEMGEEMARKYNPETLISFPFGDIESKHPDLDIFLSDLSKVSKEGDDISGLVYFKDEAFKILVDKNKPRNRQYFTIAHELGHYFLHDEQLREKSLIVDSDPILYRFDNGLSNTEEAEANFFAGSLLMPKDRVRLVWKKTKSIERCADFFEVSLSAMSVRLEVLKLVA